MTVLVTSLDRTTSTGHILTTDPTVVYVVPDGVAMAKGVGMKLAGSGTVTIEWQDVSEDETYVLAQGLSIDENGYHDFDLLGMALDPGDELIVTGGSGVHVTTVIMESFGR